MRSPHRWRERYGGKPGRCFSHAGSGSENDSSQCLPEMNSARASTAAEQPQHRADSAQSDPQSGCLAAQTAAGIMEGLIRGGASKSSVSSTACKLLHTAMCSSVANRVHIQIPQAVVNRLGAVLPALTIQEQAGASHIGKVVAQPNVHGLPTSSRKAVSSFKSTRDHALHSFGREKSDHSWGPAVCDPASLLEDSPTAASDEGASGHSDELLNWRFLEAMHLSSSVYEESVGDNVSLSQRTDACSSNQHKRALTEHEAKCDQDLLLSAQVQKLDQLIKSAKPPPSVEVGTQTDFAFSDGDYCSTPLPEDGVKHHRDTKMGDQPGVPSDICNQLLAALNRIELRLLAAEVAISESHNGDTTSLRSGPVAPCGQSIFMGETHAEVQTDDQQSVDACTTIAAMATQITNLCSFLQACAYMPIPAHEIARDVSQYDCMDGDGSDSSTSCASDSRGTADTETRNSGSAESVAAFGACEKGSEGTNHIFNSSAPLTACEKGEEYGDAPAVATSYVSEHGGTVSYSTTIEHGVCIRTECDEDRVGTIRAMACAGVQTCKEYQHIAGASRGEGENSEATAGVEIDIDANGILNASAADKLTGTPQTVEATHRLAEQNAVENLHKIVAPQQFYYYYRADT